MNNEQKANEIAKKYQTPCHGMGDCEFEAYQSALEAMEWKEQILIDKACKWLKENVSKHLYGTYCFNKGLMLEEFEQAMKGGDNESKRINDWRLCAL